MFEKNGPVFQSEREIRAISLNEWQTPDFHVNNAGTKKKRKGFLKSLIIMEEFFSSQVAQLINGKNPRESWHFWPKMDLFSERIFMTVNLLKTLGKKKILADGKQVFFAVGDIDSSQDKWTFVSKP